MKWNFLKCKCIEPEPIPRRRGSFLFATTLNKLKIISIDRIDGRTAIVSRDKDNLPQSCRFYYEISDAQHEEFVNNISKKLECLVVKGDNP